MDVAERDARRRLLARSDALLGRIEELRLNDILRVPEQLQTQIADLATAAGQRPPRQLGALPPVHGFLFRLQGVLMSRGGPQQSRTAGRLPALTLPAPDRAATDAEWQERVRLVVQRAHDRVSYLESQVRAADRLPTSVAGRLGQERRTQAASAREAADRLEREAEHAMRGAQVLDPPPVMRTSGRLTAEATVIDLDEGTIRHEGHEVSLRQTERRCLVALASNPGRVLTREAMLHLVYGDDPKIELRSGALDVHMSNLRAKLGHPSYLRTIVGVGFEIGAAQPTTRRGPVAHDDVALRERRRQRARHSSGSPPPPAPPAGPSIGRQAGR